MKSTTKKKEVADAESAVKKHPWSNGGLPGWECGSPQKPDEMSPEVLEFLKALEDYRERYHRQFPNWSEVLGIITSLGYRKVAKPG